MTTAGEQTRLNQVTPAAIHLVDVALVKVTHAPGVFAVRNLMQLARLASARSDKPGFQKKVEDAQQAIPMARQECEAFFSIAVSSDCSIGDLFSETRQAALTRLNDLPRLPLESQAEAIGALLAEFTNIRSALKARRHSVRGLLEGLIVPLTRLCEGGQVNLMTCLIQTEDCEAFLDPQRLGAAITELVANAVRHAFHRKGGLVRIELKPVAEAGEAVIIVEDDGSGISEEVRGRIFERGVTTGGTGEGLHLVREIVEGEHLGRIAVTTGEAGTRWEIALPIRVPAERLRKYLPPALLAEPAVGARRKWRWPRIALAVALLAVGAAGLALAVNQAVSWWSRMGAMPAQPTGNGPAEEEMQKDGLIPRGWAPGSPAPAPPSPQVPPPAPVREMTHSATGIQLIYVPAGEFVMGSDLDTTESPPRRVKITRPFWLGKFPVTQREYEKVMGENPSRRKGPDLPVEQVSYVDVAQFCIKAGLRLPTEAEWEFAARGSSVPTEPSDVSRVVGGGTANPQGFRDMLGNVAEWCADWHGLYDPRDTVDPQGPKRGSRRVIRGGSFLADPAALRPAMRASADSLARNDFIGFRVAMDAAAQPEQGK
jgi:formylglycine-generating enzyme required for sulfatase activity